MQLISPEKIFRGKDAWIKAIPEIKKIAKRPLILGRSLSTNSLRQHIHKDLANHNLEVYRAHLEFD